MLVRPLCIADRDQILEIHRSHGKIMRAKDTSLMFDYKATVEKNIDDLYLNNNEPKFTLWGAFTPHNELQSYMAVQKVPQIAAWILNYVKARKRARFNINTNGMAELFDFVTMTLEQQMYFKVYYTRSVTKWPTKQNSSTFFGLGFTKRYIPNVEYYVPAGTLPPEEFTMFRGLLGNVPWPNDIVIISRTLKEEQKPFPRIEI